VSFMLVLASLLSVLIERPAQRIIRDYYKKRTAAPVAQST
jgi:hypothetical protein